MEIKLAFDVSRCNIPDVVVENVTTNIPKPHLESHPLGEELVIFEEYIYNTLREFKDDISAVFVDEIENNEVSKNIERYAKSFNMEVLRKEDGNVTFVVLSLKDSESLKADIQEFAKEESSIEGLYCIIPIECLTYVHELEEIPKPWNSESFYKQAFGIFLNNLEKVLTRIS